MLECIIVRKHEDDEIGDIRGQWAKFRSKIEQNQANSNRVGLEKRAKNRILKINL